jgi:hypothetical protein
MARYDDIDTKFVFFATLVSILLLIAILQGTQALCYNMNNAMDAARDAKSEFVDSSRIIGEQKASLAGYKKVSVPPALGQDGKPVSDKPTSQIQIPIETAEKLLLEEAKKKSNKT